MGLDYRVWRVILVMGIIPLGLLGYRIMDTKKCKTFSFSIKSISEHRDSVFIAGETLTFIAFTDAKEISWDFGDHSAKQNGPSVTHQYQTNGVFYVTVSAGSACDMVRQITVQPVSELQHKAENMITGDEISGPSTTIAGKEEMFSCMITANTYLWSILNYPKMMRTGLSAKFQFPATGKYIVQVTLDNDRTKRYSKEIMVTDAPKPKIDAPKNIGPLIPGNLQVPANKKIMITDEIFKSYMEKVVDKQMKVDDFSDYLCYGGDTRALLNGALTTFAGLCDEISGKTRRKFIIGRKKIRITSAVMRRDNGCVNMVDVQYH